MKIKLPKLGKAPVALPHFPTRHQAFIFRAYEYVPPAMIARILGTTEEVVNQAAADMGLKKPCTSRVWLEKGYITIIRRLWHILPYEQMLSLLGMEEEELAVILREEDFLDYKLGDKPVCEPVVYRELTQEEIEETRRVKEVVESVDLQGAEPFAFQYDVKDMKFSGKEQFGLRMVYGFSGLYQHAFDVDSRTYCPDEMLEAYQKVGVNAIWTQGVLFQLAEFPFHKELSKGYEKRLERLRELTERCDKYGIKIFLYLNEPRSMPENFYEKYPKMKGHKGNAEKVCMCTSTKEVQEYLTNSVEFICRQVPKLGGFFTITRSENFTNCYSHTTPETCTCPRCSKRSVGEVIAEVVGCFEKGAHRVNPDIKVITWSWGWEQFNLDVIKALPQNVILQSQSELYIPRTIGGVDTQVVDYSMGIIGPGEHAKAEWRAARERGLKTCAKVQVNTTWEGSTVPALPVYSLIEEHIRAIKEEGVTDLMLGWTLGGFPSRNIMYAAKYFYENYDADALVETPAKKEAAQLFSEAFQEFPFHIGVLYMGPQNGGPGNLLFREPTGYKATMTCYAYDDLESWCSIFPEDVFEEQLHKLCKKWEEGLAVLERARESSPTGSAEAEGEMEIMGGAAYCLFRASLNQVRFYRARKAGDKAAMIAAAEAELVCARKMLSLMNQNPAIGFEAANHYYYSKGCLCEKILNCSDVIRSLQEEK